MLRHPGKEKKRDLTQGSEPLIGTISVSHRGDKVQSKRLVSCVNLFFSQDNINDRGLYKGPYEQTNNYTELEFEQSYLVTVNATNFIYSS